MTWAACWLYKATGEQEYLGRAEELFDEFDLGSVYQGGFGWGKKFLGAHALLYSLTKSDRYLDLLNSTVTYYLNDAPYTPLGLLYLSDWGSLKNSANTMFALLHVG